MLSFDEVWWERELAKFPIVPDSELEEASARLVEAENRLPSLTTEPESESEREIGINNFAVKAKHRKHFHSSMEEGKYHNGSRGNKPEKTYALYNKSEARRKEKETFKTEIPFHLTEAEQELADTEEENYYSDADISDYDDYDYGFEEGKEYVFKVLRTMGIIKNNKFTVESLGEVSFKDLERYYAQLL